MADALLGKCNPSGKLNESWPLKLEDNPSYPYFPSKERTAEYREGLYIGYRYYDTTGTPVRYPFGYGLSYNHLCLQRYFRGQRILLPFYPHQYRRPGRR